MDHPSANGGRGIGDAGIERELRQALKRAPAWPGSADVLWRRLEEGLRGGRLAAGRGFRVPVWATAAVATCVIAGLALAGRAQWLGTMGGNRTPGPTNGQVAISAGGEVNAPGVGVGGGRPTGGLVMLIATMSGSVTDIKGGKLLLSDVSYVLPRDFKGTKPGPELPLPAGRWVTPNHWQSDGGTLDLFKGEQVVYFIEHNVIAPEFRNEGPNSSNPWAKAPQMRFIYGEVTRIAGDKVTVLQHPGYSKVPNDWNTSLGNITLRLAPYSRRGNDPALKVKDQVIIGYFGDSTDQIIWQYTVVNR